MSSIINASLILIIVLGMIIATGDNRLRDFFAYLTVWLGCFFIAMQLGQSLVLGITAWTWPFVLLIVISGVVSGIACYLLVELAVRIHRWINR